MANNGNGNRKVGAWLYLLTFVIIYTPTFFQNDIVNYLLPFLYFILTLFLPRERIKNNKFVKAYRRVIFFLIVAGLYFCVRALIGGVEIFDIIHLRLVQSFQIIISIASVYNITCYLSKIGYSDSEKMRFLLNVCVVQFAIVMVMIVFPGVRTILLERFYQNMEAHYWTVSKRVYGIMSNYTYAGAIFHGMMMVVAYCYGLTKDKKFLLYIPLLLIMVLLNGRTGLLVGVIGIALCTIILLSKNNFVKTLKYTVVALLSIFLVFQALKVIFPSTYVFIMNGIDDTISFFSNDEKTGNALILSNAFENNLNVKSFLVGNGHRIQNAGDIPVGLPFEYSYSDMGYLNDMFMGGIPYMLMLYIPMALLIMTRKKDDRKDFGISIFLLLTMILCNAKGEVFRSSIIMASIIYIKAALEQSEATSNELKEKDG